MSRRRFTLIATVAAALQVLALFSAMFGGILLSSDGTVHPDAEAMMSIANVLLEPMASIFHPTSSEHAAVVIAAVIANGATWGITIAGLATAFERVRNARRGAF